ncbi:MAG: hypothetical protein KDA60_02205 [Planctomycetales bacterium]|nr:hypothetical protein [Planctomycetales bacterium]
MAMHLKKRWLDRRVYEYFAVHIAPWIGWRDPILVYQMGKVASSSIRNSLFRCPDPSTRLVLMSHEYHPIRTRDPSHIDIEPEYRDYVLQEIEHDKQVFRQFSLRKKLGWRFRERMYAEQIYRSYVKRQNYRLRVISPIREPVGNNISMFFEVFDHYAGVTAAESPVDVESMIDMFLARYVHGRPLTWFDAEVKRTLGIDVFQSTFPREQGHGVFRTGNVELLVLKSELDDETKSHAIADFLGLESLTLVRSNVSSNRGHADKYAEFKQKIRIPSALLDAMYNSKYAQFFYTPDELAQFRNKWSGQSIAMAHDRSASQVN